MYTKRELDFPVHEKSGNLTAARSLL